MFREKNLIPFSNTCWDAQEEGAWSSRALVTILSLSPPLVLILLGQKQCGTSAA